MYFLVSISYVREVISSYAHITVHELASLTAYTHLLLANMVQFDMSAAELKLLPPPSFLQHNFTI